MNYSIEKFIIMNNKIYGAAHFDIFSLNINYEVQKCQTTNRPVHEIVFKGVKIIIDFVFA